MVSIEELASIGRTNYARKIPGMRASFRASASRAQSGFDGTPFGPTRKAAYKAAWSVMPDHYDTKVSPGLENKWSSVWTAKMRE